MAEWLLPEATVAFWNAVVAGIVVAGTVIVLLGCASGVIGVPDQG